MKLSSVVVHPPKDEDDDEFDWDGSITTDHHHHNPLTSTPTKSSSNNNNATSKQDRLREKAEEINLVLLEPDVDLWRLRELALSEGGLVNDTIRRRAWPKLVGLNTAKEPELNHPITPTNNTNNNNRAMKNRIRNAVHFTGGPLEDDTNNHNNPDSHHHSPSTDNTDNHSISSYDSICGAGPPVECLDAEQIERDVARCTWHLLTGGQRSRRRIMVNKHRTKVARVLRRKQRRLGDLINLTLIQSEDVVPTGGTTTQQPTQSPTTKTPPSQQQQRLCYYQGYHDVASIFLSALGGASVQEINTYHQKQQQSPRPSNNTATTTEPTTTTSVAEKAASMGLDLPTRVLYQVSMSHFREPMRSNFLQLQTTLRLVLFPLLAALDPELHAHLYGCGMEPFFAISWIITWFAHDIRDTAVVKRLFDVFLVAHPLMPMYVSIAMLCHPANRREVLATPCEFAELHNTLTGLPKNSSMVGWKYRVGDGYVSEDESVGGDDGATDISLDSDMASQMTGGGASIGYGNRGGDSLFGMGRDHLVLSESHAQVVSMGLPEHVPFQELIDTAISFMREIPPRKILGIAARYYAWAQASSMLEMAPKISFFQPPPHWALASKAKADWVLKQRAREQRRGNAGQTRKNRRVGAALRNRKKGSIEFEEMITPVKTNRSKRRHEENVVVDEDGDEEKETCTPEMVEKSAKELKWPKAMVAQGFGPGQDEAEKRRKRRKMLLVGGAAAVALVAIAVGVSMAYQKPQQKVQKPPKRVQPAATSPSAASASADSATRASVESDSPKMAATMDTVLHQQASPSDIRVATENITVLDEPLPSTADGGASHCSEPAAASIDDGAASETDPQTCSTDSIPARTLIWNVVSQKARLVASNLQQFAHIVENPIMVAVRVKHVAMDQAVAVLGRLRRMAHSVAEHRNLGDATVRNRIQRTAQRFSRDVSSVTKTIIRNAREQLGGDGFDNFLLM